MIRCFTSTNVFRCILSTDAFEISLREHTSGITRTLQKEDQTIFGKLFIHFYLNIFFSFYFETKEE